MKEVLAHLSRTQQSLTKAQLDAHKAQQAVCCNAMAQQAQVQCLHCSETRSACLQAAAEMGTHACALPQNPCHEPAML